MPGFTSGGGKRAPVKKSDGLLPTKKAAPVKMQTGKKGFPIADAGGVAPRASQADDGTPFDNEHMSEAMSGGKGGPAHGKSFHAKFNTSAMSQAVRGKAKAGLY